MADSAPPSIGIALPPTSVLKIRDACLPCRKQRSKCDGQPCCSRCARLELECTYVELVKAPTPAPKEPWQEFLATTGTKPETFETLASELFNDPAVVPVSDTTTFPWQKPKVARRRKQTSSVRCTCPVTSTPTSMSSPMSMSMSSPDPAGQDSLLQSPLAQDVPDPFTKSPDPQSAPFYSTNSNAAPAAELGQSGTNSKRKGRSTSGPCRVHQPHLFSKPPRSAAQIGPSTVSTGASSSTSSMDGHGGAGPSGAPAGLLPSGHRHRPPPTEPAPLPTAVIETSEKINNLSSKLSRLFLFPDNSVPPPPPQLAILQSRSLSPVLQSHLIQLYLTYCWPTQPILDPHTFMARLAAQEYCTPPHPLLIAAMCAAAARCIDDTDIEALWEEHDLPNPIYPSYANGEPRVRSARDMICSIGEYFGSLAKGYLRTELPLVQSPDRSGGAGDPLTVVQGLIMISTWDASIGRQRECQACSALALRIMIAGGWHLMDHPNGDGCTDSRIKMWGTLERELARRCWWFVWVAEKWTAAILTQYVTLHLSLCETLSLPREFRQGDPNDNLTVRYFQQTIQGAYLCGAVIQLHYHPYEAEDGTEYHHEISLEDYKRLEARLNEIDTHLEAWFKALPGDLRPDWGEGAGEDSGDGQGFKPGGSSQFFVAGGEWWWRHYVGSLLELNYYALKLLLHHPPHVVSKIPSPVSRLKLAQMANKITLTCERLWQYPTTRPVFYHMAGPILWLALCYQQENTLSENPRIRTPACVNMQKSYYLVKKAGRLVHANEDEPLTELESVSGNSTTATPSFLRLSDDQHIKPIMEIFKEMFPVIRQTLRDKGFGLRTRPNATSKISPSMLLPNQAPSPPAPLLQDMSSSPAIASMPSSVDPAPASTMSSISAAAAAVINTAGSSSPGFYLAPLTPPGTSNTAGSSPVTDSLGSAPSPSPPPNSIVHNGTSMGSLGMASSSLNSNIPVSETGHVYAPGIIPGIPGIPDCISHQQQHACVEFQMQQQSFVQNQQSQPLLFQQQQQQTPPTAIFNGQQSSSMNEIHFHGSNAHHPSIPLQSYPQQQQQQQQQQLFTVQSIQTQNAQGILPQQAGPSLSRQPPVIPAGLTGLSDPLSSIMNMSPDPFGSIMQNEPNVLSSIIDYSEWINHSLE